MRITGSALERIDICPSSVVYPPQRELHDDDEKWTARGVVVHSFLERVPAIGRDAALDEVPLEHRDFCEAIDLAQLPACNPDAFAPEVAFVYDIATDTARELGRGIGRNYGIEGDQYVCLTVDTVGLTADAVVVYDYKTGWKAQKPPQDHWQLRAACLAAARTYKRKKAIGGIIQLDENGEPRFRVATFDLMDLEATAYQLSRIRERIHHAAAAYRDGGIMPHTSGSHCNRCPAYNVCRAKTGLAAQLAAGVDVGLRPPVLNEASAPHVLARLEEVEELCKAVRASLEEYASSAPIPLADGYVYGKKPHPHPVIDAQLAVNAISKEFAGESAAIIEPMVETDPVVTFASLERGVRKHIDTLKAKPRGIISRTMERARKALEASGAVTTRWTYPITKHKPKTAALAAAGGESDASGQAGRGNLPAPLPGYEPVEPGGAVAAGGLPGEGGGGAGGAQQEGRPAQAADQS